MSKKIALGDRFVNIKIIVYEVCKLSRETEIQTKLFQQNYNNYLTLFPSKYSDSSLGNKETEEQQEYFYQSKNQLWKFCDKAYCRDATPSRFCCLISRA